MKITLVGPTYPYRGGIAHHTTCLYHALRVKHTLDFIGFRRQYPQRLFPGRSDQDPSQPPIDVVVTPLLDPLNPLTWRRTASRVRFMHADVLIFPWWEPFWAIPFATIAYLVKRVGVRVLFVCHNVTPHETRPGALLLSRLALRQGDGFVIQSIEDGSRLTELVPHAKFRYAPHPIYAQFGGINEPHRDAPLGEIPCLLFFGFVRPYKGLKILIESMPLILKQRSVRLIVAGEFWGNRESYERLIHDLGIQQSVTLIDRYIPDEQVDSFFTQADLVILPYLTVTTSAILGLAIGHGVPVVVSDIRDLAEIVNVEAIGGVAVRGDKHSLAETILKCLEPEPFALYRYNVARLQMSAAQSWERLVDAIEALV